MQRQLVTASVIFSQGSARLHRVGDESIIGELDSRDVSRLFHGRCDRVTVAERPLVACVLRDIVIYRRSSLRFRDGYNRLLFSPVNHH